MELQNKKIRKIKNMVIYFIITLFTLIVNILLFTFITTDFIGNIEIFLNRYLKLYVVKPVVVPPLGKIFSTCLMLNLLLLLIIEFVFICLFHKRMNKFSKIDNLFTIKKFLLFAVIVIGVQMLFSLWLWFV